MSDPDQTLLTHAKRMTVDAALRPSWALVIRGLEMGWLDRGSANTLAAMLEKTQDYGIEELLFDHIGDELRVSFLDDTASCPPSAMTKALKALLSET